MKNRLFFLPGLIALLGIFVFPACVDLEFDAPPPAPPCEWEVTNTIAELKARYTGSDWLINEPIIIEGVVVADDSSGNFYRALIIQDATAGIELRFSGTDLYNDYAMGRKVYVNCEGLLLSNYNGVLQLGEIQEALIENHICRGPKNQVVEPKVVTIADLNESLIHTLIRIEDIQFDDGSAGVTYADAVNLQTLNLTLAECSGENTILLRTSGYSDIATAVTPTGSGSVTAIYSVFQSDQQLFLRHVRDVDMPNPRCDKGLFETFSGAASNEDISLAGWTNIAIKGTRLWRGGTFSGNSYAQATAYQDTNAEMETWLVTPPINLDNPKTLSFESAQAFFTHDGLSVLISTDFTGDVAAATWTPLSCNLATSSDNNYDWVASGPVDLSAFSGTGHVAFRYTGNKTNQTTTFRLDNVKVEEQ